MPPTRCKEDVEPQFWEFLAFLGKPGRDEAAGSGDLWDGVHHSSQGNIFYHTKWQQSEFIFHVGPLMPFRPEDPQNVERKRFIGNDVVVVIFRTHRDPPLIRLSTVLSKQVHVVIVVSPRGAELAMGFTLQIYRKRDVPEIPQILHPASAGGGVLYPFGGRDVFFATSKSFAGCDCHRATVGGLTDLVMTAELTAYKSPSLASLFERPKQSFLEELAGYAR